MSFKSTGEGRVGVDGADTQRKTSTRWDRRQMIISIRQM